MQSSPNGLFHLKARAFKVRKHKIRSLDMNFYQKPIKTKGSDPFEPIPFGECVETDWAAWEETVAAQSALPEFSQNEKPLIVAAAHADPSSVYF